jgi:UDP-N-acetylbacillosamine N-acetyltransferase
MRLVILGAGGYGRTIADIASQSNQYDEIIFLDDNSSDNRVSGELTAYLKYKGVPIYPAFGDNKLRLEWINRLKSEGYIIPSIVHNSAYVSENAHIGTGTMILPKAIVNTDCVIGDGCIINLGAIIDHGCVIEDGCHICLGAIVKGENRIRKYTKIEAGEIVAARKFPV